MGWMTGFEPATSGSTIRRSNQLSYTHHPERRRYAVRQGKRILAKKEESLQLDGKARHPLASKAACISDKIAAAAAAGSEASLIGRPITK